MNHNTLIKSTNHHRPRFNAQGSLAPPGAPAPTMKTLDQIEAHASLRFDNGAERFRFEVKSVRPQELTDENAELFQPTSGCFEIQPLPF